MQKLRLPEEACFDSGAVMVGWRQGVNRFPAISFIASSSASYVVRLYLQLKKGDW